MKQRRTWTRLTGALAFVIACVPGAAWAGGKAHEHGVVQLSVAIEGQLLTIDMQAPLDNLLGFERAPRTDAERAAAASMLARLRAPEVGAPLFIPAASAQCSLTEVQVQAPVLEPVAQKGSAGEHADLDARYGFTCAQPGELSSLEVGLFDAYRRVRRIEVQVAGPKGQSKMTLKRPARVVQLLR